MSATAETGVSFTAEQLCAWRRERNAFLERRCEFLDGERSRLERLLGLALQLATSGTSVRPLDLLDALCVFVGTDPSQAAFLERRERVASEARTARLLDVLRETA